MNWIGFKALLRREILRFLKIPTQTIVPAVISSILYIAIFGAFIGSMLPEVAGVPYMVFFIPGLVMMNLVTSSYTNSAFSIFIGRFLTHITDILTAPLSYFEIALAVMLASVTRGVIVGVFIFLASLFFIPIAIQNPLLLAFFMITTASLFSSIGVIIGLAAHKFEHLEILTTFLITPLTLLGGVFHSVNFLPESLKWITLGNPFFYFINGFRYATIGISEGSLLLSIAFALGGSVVLFLVTLWLFKKGYNLRT